MISRLRRLAVVVMAIAAEPAIACSCGSKPDLATAQSRASYTVIGTVTSARPGFVLGNRLQYPADLEKPPLVPVTLLRIDIQHSFGRRAPASLELTHVGCCVCEATLKEGDQYLLFITPSFILRDAWMVSFCYPNKRAMNVGAATALLGKPQEPFRRSVRERLSSSSPRWWYEFAGNAVTQTVVNRYPYGPTAWSRLRESPWTPFTATMAGGLVVAILAVVKIRRRRRT